MRAGSYALVLLGKASMLKCFCVNHNVQKKEEERKLKIFSNFCRFENGEESLRLAQVFFIIFMNPPLSWTSRPFWATICSNSGQSIISTLWLPLFVNSSSEVPFTFAGFRPF